MKIEQKIKLVILAILFLLGLTMMLESFGVKTDFLNDQRIREFFQSSSTYEYVDLDGETRKLKLQEIDYG